MRKHASCGSTLPSDQWSMHDRATYAVFRGELGLAEICICMLIKHPETLKYAIGFGICCAVLCSEQKPCSWSAGSLQCISNCHYDWCVWHALLKPLPCLPQNMLNFVLPAHRPNSLDSECYIACMDQLVVWGTFHQKLVKTAHLEFPGFWQRKKSCTISPTSAPSSLEPCMIKLHILWVHAHDCTFRVHFMLCV